MEPQTLTPAFVLHRRRYGETSLLLELFTAGHGRLPAVARGAAGIRSKRRGLLQPFVPLLVQWRGRGEVATLTKVEAEASPLALQGEALYSAFYLNELLMRLLPRNDPSPRLFLAYRQALTSLPMSLEWSLRRFELLLLETLGYAPDLRHTHDGGRVEAARRYRYRAQLGLEAVAGDKGFSGKVLLALADDQPCDNQTELRQARDFLRALLAPHLGERPLKSRELFRTMRAVSRPSGKNP